MIFTASLRGMAPRCSKPMRTSSPANQVGPLARLAMAPTPPPRRGVAPGMGSSTPPAGPAHHQPAQRRGIGHAEHEPEHVDALSVELGPQGFGHDDVEGLRGAVGDHVRGPDEAAARGDEHDATCAPLDHRTGEVVAQPERPRGVPMHHRQALSTGSARKGR